MGVCSRCHQPRDQFRGSSFFPIFPGIRNLRVGQEMLVIDGDDCNLQLVPDMAGNRLIIGDHQVQFPACGLAFEKTHHAGGLRQV